MIGSYLVSYFTCSLMLMPRRKGNWWTTRYFVGHGSYCHALWAETEEEAYWLVKLFNLHFVDYLVYEPLEMRPSKLMSLPKGLYRPDLFHAVCFLSFLANRAKLRPSGFFLDDNSPLHSLAHYQHLGGDTRVLEAKLLALEKMVPGLPPDHIELQVTWAP